MFVMFALYSNQTADTQCKFTNEWVDFCIIPRATGYDFTYTTSLSFLFYWGALLLYEMSSNHFLMVCKSELYSPYISRLQSSNFSLACRNHAYCFCKNPRAQVPHLSIQFLWAIPWLLVTHFSLIYLADDFFLLFLVLLNEVRMLGKSKVSGVNQEDERGSWVQVFLVLRQGLRNFLSVFSWVRWHN